LLSLLIGIPANWFLAFACLLFLASLLSVVPCSCLLSLLSC
jgi:hypothetical protein